MVPVYGMNNNNNAGSQRRSRTQQSKKVAIENVAVIKSLKTSLDKIRVRKSQQQQQQKAQQQKQPLQQNSQQQKVKAPSQQKSQQSQQSEQSQQKVQPQQRQQEQQSRQQQKSQQNLPQQQKQKIQPLQQQKQKENINKTQKTDNAVQSELNKPMQPRGRVRDKSQVIQNAAVVVATNSVLREQRGKKIEQQDNNKRQAIKLVVKKEQQQPQTGQCTIVRSNSRVRIYDPSCKKEIVVLKGPKNILSPGMYYRTQDGLMSVPKNLRSNNGFPVVKNHLYGLSPLNDSVLVKRDYFHSFPQCVEKECGDWARVIIRNAKNDSSQITDSTKKFKMFATIPGQMNSVEFDCATGKYIPTDQLSGVFELAIVKGLYEKKGKCAHRFFNPKGIVGAEEFGAQARAKAQDKQIIL